MGDDDSFTKMAEPEVKVDQDMVTYKKAMKKLILVSFVSIFFIAAQLYGGYMANSIAIFTDTAHLASDMIGFMMSMVALKISMKPASQELTFGWHRAEVLGTLMSVAFLITLTLWLVVEATKRIITPEDIDPDIMLITAIAGLFFNLIQMSILHQGGDGHYHLGGESGGGCGHDHPKAVAEGDDHGHSHDHGDHEHGHAHEEKPKERRNINVDAAYLHVLGDMIMSIGVIIASVIIWFEPSYKIADPICTYVFSMIVCVTVRPIVSQCIQVLLEGSPDEVDTVQLLADVRAIDGVKDVHDFHLWCISVGKFALSAHVHCENSAAMEVLKKVTELCKKKYNIDHITVQMEDNDSETNDHAFDCLQTTHKELIM